MPTPEEENEAAKKAQSDDINARKTRLKRDANDTENLAKLLAKKVPPAGGVTLDEFEKWVPGFESGFVTLTPESGDTPYDEPYEARPKVKILDKGDSSASPSPSPTPKP
jgi:hypothetical protein